MRREDLVEMFGRQDPCAPLAASACRARIMMASGKPRSSMISARMMYMIPMRLWSTEVIHSRHRYGTYPLRVTHERTAK